MVDYHEAFLLPTSMNTHDPQLLINKAFDEGQYDRGLQLLRKLNQSGNGDAGSWNRQAVVEEQIGDWAVAGRAHASIAQQRARLQFQHVSNLAQFNHRYIGYAQFYLGNSNAIKRRAQLLCKLLFGDTPASPGIADFLPKSFEKFLFGMIACHRASSYLLAR